MARNAASRVTVDVLDVVGSRGFLVGQHLVDEAEQTQEELLPDVLLDELVHGGRHHQVDLGYDEQVAPPEPVVALTGPVFTKPNTTMRAVSDAPVWRYTAAARAFFVVVAVLVVVGLTHAFVA